MNQHIKVTFTMMAYNVEKYIEKAVRSVLEQTVPEIVICVRDNGSTDCTGEILERLASEDSRVHVVHNRINGITDDGTGVFGEGWWLWDKSLIGEYISILDGDDYLESDFVEKLYAAAVENGADIVAAGNYYFNEEYGQYNARVPDAIVTDALGNIGEHFKSVYNCFRTWWGKIFRSEFFLEHYYEAWRWHHPLHWCIDTLIMMDYLNMCQKLVTIKEPLYNMYVRSDSTYQQRPFDHGILWGAYALYQNNKKFLEKHGLASADNVKFIKELHWAYIKEGLVGFCKNESISPRKKIFHIQIVLNDSIVRDYLPDLFEIVYGTLEPLLDVIEQQAGDDVSIYENYIMRLKCFTDSVKADDRSSLNYPLLLGALFDPHNRNWFGMKFLELPIRGGSQGIKWHLPMKEEAWMYFSENPELFLDVYYNCKDKNPEVQEGEKCIIEQWEAGQYEKCYELVEQVSEASNLSQTAMRYRILLYDRYEEYAMAVLMAYTAKNIYKYDAEMAAVCDEIIEKRTKRYE